MSRYGIIVSEPGDTVSSNKQKRLDSRKKQFKYRKIIDFKFPVPTLLAGTSYNSEQKFYFREDGASIGFIPAYEYYVKAYNDNWGIPVIASPQAYEASLPEYPFFRYNEYITDQFLNLGLYIANRKFSFPTVTYNYPAHVATLRLIIMHDDLRKL